MPRYASKKADEGVPTTLERDRYEEGQYPSPVEGACPLAISPTGKTIPVQVTPDGYLRIFIEGASCPTDVEQHQEGDSETNAFGIAVLGKDGTYLHFLKVDSSGKLQVVSDTDIVQYQDGGAETTPIGTIALGYDGANVRAVAVDANGYLQVSGAAGGGGEQHADGDADAGAKGNLILGDDGANLQTVAVNSDGQLLIGNMPTGININNWPADYTVANPTEQHSGGDSNTGTKGIIVLGNNNDDGILHRIHVNSSGQITIGNFPTGLNVNNFPASQTVHEDTPLTQIAVLGYDGSYLQTISVDSNGKILIGNFPTGLNVNNFPTGFNVNNPNEQHGDGDSGVTAKGNLILGDKSGTLKNITLDSRGSVRIANQGAEFFVGPDVSLGAGATTKIASAYSGRHGFIIGNLASNTDIFRIGDSTADATHGIELAPGETMYIQTDSAVYGYNPGGTAQSVCVGSIED